MVVSVLVSRPNNPYQASPGQIMRVIITGEGDPLALSIGIYTCVCVHVCITILKRGLYRCRQSVAKWLETGSTSAPSKSFVM